MIKKFEHLLPKELDCSVVMVDTWEPLDEAGVKLFEVKMEDVESVLNKLKPKVPSGCFILVYDRNGNVVAEYMEKVLEFLEGPKKKKRKKTRK
ncbi:MAG: hypothetical protein QXY92_08650 [Archaeoglobaceae archaeon]